MLAKSFGGITFVAEKVRHHLHKFLTLNISPPSLIGIINVFWKYCLANSPYISDILVIFEYIMNAK